MGYDMIADGPMPKHEQLRAILVDLIERGLDPGVPIPSERELTERHAVSRATVREAVGQLVQEGRLTRVHGKGTFVAERPVVARLHLASFSEDMRRRGLEPSTTLIAAGATAAPDEVAARLQMPGGSEVARIERVRVADGTPMALEVGWYPLARLPGLLDRDLRGSLYDLLATYGLRPDTGQQTIAAALADERQATLLATSPGAALLVFDRIATAGGVPVEVTVSWYRADRYRVAMALRRHDPAA